MHDIARKQGIYMLRIKQLLTE